jgi:hypothetical protein
MIPFLLIGFLLVGGGKHDRHHDYEEEYTCCEYDRSYSRKQREIDALEEQVKELRKERRERREQDYRRRLRERGNDND